VWTPPTEDEEEAVEDFCEYVSGNEVKSVLEAVCRAYQRNECQIIVASTDGVPPTGIHQSGCLNARGLRKRMATARS